jgi:hypothetical protein
MGTSPSFIQGPKLIDAYEAIKQERNLYRKSTEGIKLQKQEESETDSCKSKHT